MSIIWWRPFSIFLAAIVLAPVRADAQGIRAGAIAGTVIDSVNRRPFANAVVSAARLEVAPETIVTTTTDARGRFLFRQLVPGRYAVTFASAFLDSIEFGGPVPSRTVHPGETVRLDLAIPSGPTLRALACPGLTFPPHAGVLQGILIDAETEQRLGGGEIVVAWDALADADVEVRKAAMRNDAAPQRIARVRSDSAGGYRLCGVPTDTRLVVQIQKDGRAGTPLPVMIRDSAGVAVRNLSFSARTAAGTASIKGLVRGADGQAIDRAEVAVLHTDSVSRTNANGEFVVRGLPAGSQEIEVRRIGYVVRRELVELRSEKTVEHDVRLERVLTLDSMLTLATRSDYPEFEFRRHIAVEGRFVDEAEIDQWYRGHVNSVSDILRRIPLGPPVSGQGSNARAVDCKVYADGAPTAEIVDRIGPYEKDKGGMLNDISIWDVGAIEYYKDGRTAPLPFYVNGCVIMIWSKRR